MVVSTWAGTCFHFYALTVYNKKLLEQDYSIGGGGRHSVGRNYTIVSAFECLSTLLSTFPSRNACTSGNVSVNHR